MRNQEYTTYTYSTQGGNQEMTTRTPRRPRTPRVPMNISIDQIRWQQMDDAYDEGYTKAQIIREGIDLWFEKHDAEKAG